MRVQMPWRGVLRPVTLNLFVLVAMNPGSMLLADECRIVMVEDDPSVCSFAKTLLENVVSGVSFHMFSDAAVALEACQAIQPNLVLLDLDLPGMGGLEAAPLFRKAIGDRAILIVIAASKGSGSVQPLLVSGAVTGLIEKPLDAKSLSDLASSYLAGQCVPVRDLNESASLGARFQERLEAVGAAVACVLSSYDDAMGGVVSQDVQDLRGHIHKLAGSSGLFGFADLGRAASQAEEVIEGFQRNPGPANADLLRSTLNSLLADIDKCRRHAQLTGGK
jgi:CheY-like chemotaxis protein